MAANFTIFEKIKERKKAFSENRDGDDNDKYGRRLNLRRVNNTSYGSIPENNRGDYDECGNNKSRDIFDATVAVRVSFVFFFAGNFETNNGDDGAHRIKNIINGVDDYRDGAGKNPDTKFSEKKNKVAGKGQPADF